MCWNIILWIQWSRASYTYIKVLEGFSVSWTVNVNASNRVGHPLKDVCTCWQEFGGIRWRSHHCKDVIVFRLNKEDLGRQRSPLCKEDIGLRLGRDMQRILPLLLGANCKEFLQQRCMSRVNLIMVYVVRKLTVSRAASVCTLECKPQLMFHFSDPSQYCQC
jgi:hypothetical protein